MVLVLLDKSQLGKSFITNLEHSSLKSLVHEPVYLEVRPVTSNIKAFNKIIAKENLLVTKFKELSASLSPISTVNNPLLLSGNTGSMKKLAGGIWPVYSQTKLPQLYYFYISQKRSYLGCDAIFFPKGICWSVCGVTLFQISPGIVENFLLFFVNVDPMLSCLYTLKYSYVSRNGRRIVYIVSNCVIFFIQAFAGSLFNLYGYSLILSNAFDVLVVSPLVSYIEDLVLIVYLSRNEDSASEKFSIQYWLRQCRPVILTLLVMVSFLSIFIASLFACHSNNSTVIINFILYVQLPAFLYHLITTMLRFVSTFHFLVYVRMHQKSVTLLNIGDYYIEDLVRRHAVEGKDYITMEWSAMGGCIVCNYVIDKKYADLKGLQKTTLEPESKVYEIEDVENAFRFSNIYDVSRISYANKHNLDNVVNDFAISMKYQENSADDMKRESGDDHPTTFTFCDSTVEMIDYYEKKQNANQVQGTSHHALFLSELNGSKSFKKRFELASATLNPMLTIADENDVVREQLSEKHDEEAMYRTSTSEELNITSNKVEKLLADGKRKSFVNVFKTWEELEAINSNGTPKVSSASNTMALYKNINKAKNLFSKNVNNKK